MDQRFFDRPILNSPYAYPTERWELDADGQPTKRDHRESPAREVRLADPEGPKRKRRTDGWSRQGF